MEAQRLNALTGLRFFAALWVMLFHYREITPQYTYRVPLFDLWLQWGGLGVELFFILSGFIMFYVYSRTFRGGVTRKEYGTFITYRIARLYPLHLLTFVAMMILYAISVALGSAAAPERFTGAMVVSTLTMTHSWFPGIITPNQPAWSISAEFFAYLLFPWLCLLVYTRRWTILPLAILGVALGIASDVAAPHYEWILNDGLVRVAAGFLIGTMAYLFQERIARLLHSPWSGWICLGMIVLWLGVDPSPDHRHLVALPAFALLILALAMPLDRLAALLASPWAVYLGEVSFSIYMLHWIVRIVGRELLIRLGLISTLHPLVIIGSWCAITIGAAAICHRFVETPGRDVIRHLVRWRLQRAAIANSEHAP